MGEHRRIVRASSQVLQLLGLAPDLVAGSPDDAAGLVGELLGGADLVAVVVVGGKAGCVRFCLCAAVFLVPPFRLQLGQGHEAVGLVEVFAQAGAPDFPGEQVAVVEEGGAPEGIVLVDAPAQCVVAVSSLRTHRLLERSSAKSSFLRFQLNEIKFHG